MRVGDFGTTELRDAEEDVGHENTPKSRHVQAFDDKVGSDSWSRACQASCLVERRIRGFTYR